LTVQSVFIAAAIAIAVAALLRARRIARRLDQIVESYWELRYENGQLRARLDTLQGTPDDSPASGATAFVPLSRLRTVTAPGDTNATFDEARRRDDSAQAATIRRP
jgi:hypothetical protein